jgi:hypothetical protein
MRTGARALVFLISLAVVNYRKGKTQRVPEVNLKNTSITYTMCMFFIKKVASLTVN